MVAFAISDLRAEPRFLDTVADRVWRAWWKPHGHPLEKIAGGLRGFLDATRLPFALVAHDGDRYLGSTLAIAADLDERPQYSPWVAAVWVEPDARLRHIGRTLVDSTARALFERGFARIYLCSSVERRAFYGRGGWTPIEENVGPHAQTVYVRDA